MDASTLLGDKTALNTGVVVIYLAVRAAAKEQHIAAQIIEVAIPYGLLLLIG